MAASAQGISNARSARRSSTTATWPSDHDCGRAAELANPPISREEPLLSSRQKSDQKQHPQSLANGKKPGPTRLCKPRSTTISRSNGVLRPEEMIKSMTRLRSSSCETLGMNPPQRSSAFQAPALARMISLDAVFPGSARHSLQPCPAVMTSAIL